MLKKLWNDPVWSKVIAGVILAGGALVSGYFFNWLPAGAAYASNVFDFSVARTNVPNWLIGALILGVVPTIILIGAVIWISLRPEAESRPDWRTYRSDMFFGLRWRWDYFGQSVGHMHTFCPRCDFQVLPNQASAFAAVDRISFHCESCQSALGSFDESWGSLEDKARRFVQQKLRNDLWQTPA